MALPGANPAQAIFPDYPRQSPVLNEKGDFNALWDLGLGQLFQSLQSNFTNEGIVFPPLSSKPPNDQFGAIQDLYSSYIGKSYDDLTAALPDISGKTAYNLDTYFTMQFNIATQLIDMVDTVIVAQWVPLAVMLTNAGDPNASVAGVLNWQCFDTTNHILYVCTTAGNPGTWTQV